MVLAAVERILVLSVCLYRAVVEVVHLDQQLPLPVNNFQEGEEELEAWAAAWEAEQWASRQELERTASEPPIKPGGKSDRRPTPTSSGGPSMCLASLQTMLSKQVFPYRTKVSITISQIFGGFTDSGSLYEYGEHITISQSGSSSHPVSVYLHQRILHASSLTCSSIGGPRMVYTLKCRHQTLM